MVDEGYVGPGHKDPELKAGVSGGGFLPDYASAYYYDGAPELATVTNSSGSVTPQETEKWVCVYAYIFAVDPDVLGTVILNANGTVFYTVSNSVAPTGSELAMVGVLIPPGKKYRLLPHGTLDLQAVEEVPAL